ncbi:MAG: LuxR C-terminal-related transcriptional regulator [Spirochaetaceae bacterium]
MIDLSGWNFSQDGVAPLEGEWSIYWGRLLSPQQLAPAANAGGGTAEGGPAPDGLFTMPDIWDEWPPGPQRVGGIGYATFTATVRLPNGMTEGGLRVPNASTAYRLWGNGELLAESGVPGTTRETTTPHYRMETTRFSAPEQRLDLLLQVSNFHHRRGGMWRPIELGRVEQVESKDTMETVYDLLLIGSFLAMALYNLVLFAAGGRRTASPLLLSLLFAVLAVRIPVMGEMIATQIMPGFPWEVQLRIEYITAQLALLTLTWALHAIYPDKIRRWFVRTIAVFVAVNVAIVLIGSILFYSRIVRFYLYGMLAALAFMVGRLVVAFFRGDREAGLGTVAAVITLLITAGEFIHYSGWILSRDFAPFGFLITLFAGDSVNQTTAYLISASLNLVLIFASANLLVLKGSTSLFRVAEGRGAVATGVAGAARDVAASAGGAPPSAHHAASQHAQEVLRNRHHLTRREAETVHLVAEGLSNKGVAARLFVSEATVKTHMHRIMRKLGAANRTEVGRIYLTILLEFPEA